MTPLLLLQLLLTTLLASVAAEYPSKCSKAAWLKGLQKSGCLGNSDETACMCSKESNWRIFYKADVPCHFPKESFPGEPSWMDCDGYSWWTRRDVAITGPTPATSMSLDLPVQTTFATHVKRDPAAQVDGLMPWLTFKAAPNPATMTPNDPHAITTVKIWYCGVPGEACNIALGSDTQPDAFDNMKPGQNVGLPVSTNTTLTSPPRHGPVSDAYPTVNQRQPDTSAPMAGPGDLQTFGLPAGITGTKPLTFGPPVPRTSSATDSDCTTERKHEAKVKPTPVPLAMGNCEPGIQCGGPVRDVKV